MAIRRKIRKGPTFIRKIKIEKLFGLYTYEIPEKSKPGISNLLLLYGDNGCGKTTLLKLIFSLLSPVTGRGEKTYIANTPFRKLIVEFDDGSSVTASRDGNRLTGNYNVLVKSSREVLFSKELIVEGGVIEAGNKDVGYLFKALNKLGISIHFLPDNRKVKTFTTEEEDEDEAPSGASGRLLFARTYNRDEANEENLEKKNIENTVRDVVSWIKQKALIGSNEGEVNANTIYLDVLKRLARPARYERQVQKNLLQGLVEKVSDLGIRSSEFSKYGLISHFPADAIIKELRGAVLSSEPLIQAVLYPYVDGIEARLNALEETRATVSRYIEALNLFFHNKAVSFTLQDGLSIRDISNKEIEFGFLSSGEKHLFLLLSNALLAKDKSTVFLIDEPELSLNVKWQRQLVSALVNFAADSNIQYIMATHSLELITHHRQNASQLISHVPSQVNLA